MADVKSARRALFSYCLDEKFETIGMVELLAELRSGLAQAGGPPRVLPIILLGAIGVTAVLWTLQALFVPDNFPDWIRLTIVLGMFFVGLNGVIWYAASRYDRYCHKVLTARFLNTESAATGEQSSQDR